MMMLHKGHARPLVGGNSRAQLQSCYHQTPPVCHKHHSAAAAAAATATGLAAAPRHSSNNNTLSGRPLLHTACEAIGNGHATTNNSSSSMPSSSCIPMMLIPMGVMTDSYKASHFLQYPEANKMVAYGEFRTGFNGDTDDTRILVWGQRYILENYVMRQWTEEDVERADIFYRTHMSPNHGPFPFPKDLFLKFVREHNGYFPVKIQALPEGSCVHVHTPVYQITSAEEYSPLCTFLETLLTMLWYPTTVATASRRARDVIEAAFETSVEGGRQSPLVLSRLHDFGFRGCCTVEQSVLGGCAHLLNFDGTDTMSAAYYVQFHLNGGRPVGMSIPATEHSVMTAWPTEAGAVLNMIDNFGTGAFATVMDSYDYTAALNQVLPAVAEAQRAAGGFWVLRPDSGDPVEVVLMALRALDKVFGSTTNSKGFKVIQGAGVIQGDGINVVTIGKILQAVIGEGFSAENVAFGMGGGLLQRVNRDTMSFATKLCHVVYADGSAHDVMKHPATDKGKISLPGVLAVKVVNGIPTVFPADTGEVAPEEDMLQVVYDCGPVEGHSWDDFDALRQHVAEQWAALPRQADNVSASLRAKVQQLRQDMHGLTAARADVTAAGKAAAVAAASAAAAKA